MGFRSSVSLLPAIQATGASGSCPRWDYLPTERASLRWSHPIAGRPPSGRNGRPTFEDPARSGSVQCLSILIDAVFPCGHTPVTNLTL